MSGSNTAAPDDYSSALTSLLGPGDDRAAANSGGHHARQARDTVLLGEALGGSPQIPMSDADKETSGLKALGDSRHQPHGGLALHAGADDLF